MTPRSRAIDELGETLSKTPEEERPEKVLFAILTDDAENASRRFTAADFKERVERQTNVFVKNSFFSPPKSTRWRPTRRADFKRKIASRSIDLNTTASVWRKGAIQSGIVLKFRLRAKK